MSRCLSSKPAARSASRIAPRGSIDADESSLCCFSSATGEKKCGRPRQPQVPCARQGSFPGDVPLLRAVPLGGDSVPCCCHRLRTLPGRPVFRRGGLSPSDQEHRGNRENCQKPSLCRPGILRRRAKWPSQAGSVFRGTGREPAAVRNRLTGHRVWPDCQLTLSEAAASLKASGAGTRETTAPEGENSATCPLGAWNLTSCLPQLCSDYSECLCLVGTAPPTRQMRVASF